MPLSTKRCRGGYILIMVLGSIVLISSIVLLFMLQSTERLKVTVAANSQAFLTAQAYSVLEISLAVINQCGTRDHALRGPRQGWEHPLDHVSASFPDGMQIRVTCSDESCKIPLHSASRELLLRAFDRMGLSLTLSDELADALLDWMDADDLKRLHGFDGSDYTDAGADYSAPGRVPVGWSELDLIHGWQGLSTEQKAQFSRWFTLQNTSLINLNTADLSVLELMEAHMATDLTAVIDELSGEDLEHGTADDRLLTDLSLYPQLRESSLWATESELIHIKVEVSYANTNVCLNALVKWNGGSTPDAFSGPLDLAYPFQILLLEENTPVFSAVQYAE